MDVHDPRCPRTGDQPGTHRAEWRLICRLSELEPDICGACRECVAVGVDLLAVVDRIVGTDWRRVSFEDSEASGDQTGLDLDDVLHLSVAVLPAQADDPRMPDLLPR